MRIYSFMENEKNVRSRHVVREALRTEASVRKTSQEILRPDHKPLDCRATLATLTRFILVVLNF